MKRRRLMEAAASDGGGAPDLISMLPDSVRLYILTLLPFKDAIRTGVLSTPWRHLWTRRWSDGSSLIFDSSGVPPSVFVPAVSRCLELRRSPRRLDGLHIVCRPRAADLPDVGKWMEHAADLQVADLLLDLSSASFDGLAVSTFSSEIESLVRLRLGGCRIENHSLDFAKLRCLEIVFLYRVVIRDSSVESLVNNCPALQTLDIRCCQGLGRIFIKGWLLPLRNLTIVDCRDVSSVSLHAPKLESLRLCGKFSQTFFHDLYALKDVYFSLGGLNSGLPKIGSNFVSSMEDLSHAEALTLCSISIQRIAESRSLMNFPNLRELQLLMATMTDENLSDIYGFFRLCSCPRLEKIFVELPTTIYDSSMKMFLNIKLEDPPTVRFNCLRLVKVNNFNGYRNEKQLVHFLMQRAILLDRMILIPAQSLRNSTHMSWLRTCAVEVLLEDGCSKLQPTHAEVFYKI